MKASQLAKRILLDLGKGALASLASFVGLMVGGMVGQALGLPTPAMPAGASMSVLMPLMLLSGVVISILLGECLQRLYARYWQRLLSAWLCSYLLYYALNTLDGLLFTPMANMSSGFVTNLFPALATAAVVALLWRPRAEDVAAGVPGLAGRGAGGWAWRLALAWLAYVPIYYLMGRIVEPFIMHYYEDPSLGLGLTVPALPTLLAMQVLRGALFLAAVLPIIMAWKGSRAGLWGWTTALIFVQIAATLVFQAYWYPLGLRIPHTLELLADSAIQAGVYVLLLARASAAVPAAA